MVFETMFNGQFLSEMSKEELIEAVLVLGRLLEDTRRSHERHVSFLSSVQSKR